MNGNEKVVHWCNLKLDSIHFKIVFDFNDPSTKLRKSKNPKIQYFKYWREIDWNDTNFNLNVFSCKL